MRIVPLIVALVAVSACGPSKLQHQALQAKTAYETESAECDRQHPDRTKKPTAPRINCHYIAHMKYLKGDPDADLLQAVYTQSLVAAERYDAGKLTFAELEAINAQSIANYNTQRTQRRNSATVANSAAYQAAAAQTQAAAARQQAINAAMPRSTTCTRVGNSTTCY